MSVLATWFRPLAWWARSAHAAACDAVGDSVAADLLGTVASYSRTLARLAFQSAGSAPALGLAMARTSDVRRRIESLERKVYRSPIPWRLLMPAMLIGCAVVIVLGGFAVSRTERSGDDNKVTTKSETDKKDGELILRSVSAETDGPIERVSNEGAQLLAFAVQRAAGLSGVVLLAGGEPAVGTEVAVANKDERVFVQSGRFGRNVNIPRVTTGADGRFTFPPPDDKFTVIALSEAGYAEASSDEFAKSSKLVLPPWGQIEGGARIGARQGSNQEVLFIPVGTAARPGAAIHRLYVVHTDDRGRFHFDRVVPGRGLVARVLVTNFPGGFSSHTPFWQEPVEVKAGQTAQVTVGGKGRPVVGRIVLDGIPEFPLDWTQNEPVTVGRLRGVRFASNIDKDGRFRIENVPSGRHTLEVSVNAPPAVGSVGPIRRTAGKASMAFNMPEMPGGRSNEPLDLGTITAKLFEAINVGDLAPDFDVERIGSPEKGRRLKLGDFRGKLVLLNFWRDWDIPNDMTVLKELQKTFGGNPRFVLVSLVCSPDIAVADKFVKKDGLTWMHGFAGDVNSGVAARYKIRQSQDANFSGRDQQTRTIPVTFLIGPDGRIMAHHLGGNDLEAVRKALENPKFFPASTTPRPPAAPAR